MNEDDINVIRDKYEYFTHPFFQFNYEELQQKIDNTKTSIIDIKQDLVDLVPKLNSMRMSSDVMAKLSKFSSEVHTIEDKLNNQTDLDDLLFSTQRKSIANDLRGSIGDGFNFTRCGFISNCESNKEINQDDMRQTIQSLTKEVQIYKEQTEQQVDLNSNYLQDLKALQKKYECIQKQLEER